MLTCVINASMLQRLPLTSVLVNVLFCGIYVPFMSGHPAAGETFLLPLPRCLGTPGLHRLHRSLGISGDTHSYSLHSLACLTQIAVESLPGGSSCSTARHRRCIMHHGPESVSDEPVMPGSWVSVGHGRMEFVLAKCWQLFLQRAIYCFFTYVIVEYIVTLSNTMNIIGATEQQFKTWRTFCKTELLLLGR